MSCNRQKEINPSLSFIGLHILEEKWTSLSRQISSYNVPRSTSQNLTRSLSFAQSAALLMQFVHWSNFAHIAAGTEARARPDCSRVKAFLAYQLIPSVSPLLKSFIAFRVFCNRLELSPREVVVVQAELDSIYVYGCICFAAKELTIRSVYLRT